MIKTTLPQNSILHKHKVNYHYVDAYKKALHDPEEKINSFHVGKAFFSSSPKWVDKLFQLRNKLAGLFGLKTSGKFADRKSQLDHFKCEPGERLGLFQVFHKTENEVVIGENDKHLDFKVSLLLSWEGSCLCDKTLTISTAVTYHNAFGRLYFFFVKPFHKLIVPVMLKGIIKELNKIIIAPEAGK
jgi:hypothetical protein